MDPRHAQTAYAGGADGGVWKTTNGGQSWSPLTDDQPSLSTGSIALDPSDPDTVYVGTGEDPFTGDSYAGDGILKSIDGGNTWTNIPGPFVGLRVSAIAVDPGNGSHVLAAVSSSGQPGSGGVFQSEDGGNTWTQTLANGYASAVIFGKGQPATVYAVMSPYAFATETGLFKSTDGGSTWVAVGASGANALPAFPSYDYIAFAQAASAPGTMYIGVDGVIYKTTDAGANWAKLTSPNYCGQQCSYDNVLAVDPDNANSIYAGGSADFGVDGVLIRSLDGGQTWSAIEESADFSTYIHTDTHAIVFSPDDSRVYVGTDGGVWSSTTWATTSVLWSDLNTNLGLAQFYQGITIHPTNPGITFGGTQDNGNLQFNGQAAWNYVDCGDGGAAAIDPINPLVVYDTCGTGNALGVSTQGGALGTFEQPSKLPSLADEALRFTSREVLVDTSNHKRVFYTDGDTVYESQDGGATWASASPSFSTNFGISDLVQSESNPDLIYAGLFQSGVAVTQNATTGSPPSWTTVTLPFGVFPSSVAVDPTQPATAYMGAENVVGGPTIWKTTDGGSTWTGLTTTGLPNLTVSAIVVDPDVANTLYAALDFGVYASSDGGQTWTELGAGLPGSGLIDLKLFRPGRILRVATHGRGMWDLSLGPVASPLTVSPAAISFPQTAPGVTSTAQTVTLSNTGASPVMIYGIAASGDYAETSNCPAVLQAGSNCTANVTFTPGAGGTRAGALTFTTEAPGSPTQAVLTGTGTGPGIVLAPASLSFGSQGLLVGSSAQNVTLTNNGVAALAISSIVATGDFSETSNCGTSVAVGANCTIEATFTPTAAGARSGSLTVTDNTAGSPQQVPLTGTGVAPSITISPNTLAFGNQAHGVASAPQTFTLTNTGPGQVVVASVAHSDSEFAETNGCTSPVAPGGSCQVGVTYTPVFPGTANATVFIYSNAAGSPAQLTVTGTDVNPAASVVPSSLAFGDQQVGVASPAQSVTLTNSSVVPLSINQINMVLGEDYSQTNNCGSSLAASSSCTISVTLTPTNTGARANTLQVSDNAPSSLQTVALTGTGTASAATLSTQTLAFGSQRVGVTSAAQSVGMTNTGNVALAITSIAASGDFGATNNCPASLAAGSNCTISVSFSPTATGSRTGSLTVSDNASGSPQNVALTGTGIAAGIGLSPSSLTFSGQAVATSSSAQQVTIANTGTTTLVIASLAVTGDYGETNTCGVPINVGGSCTASVTFTPSASGSRTGTLSVADNAPGSPQSVALSGTGLAPAMALSGTSLAFGNQTVKLASTAGTVQVTNTGNAPLDFTSLSLAGANAADFDLAAGTTCTRAQALAASVSCNVEIVYTPSVTAAESATLTAAGNASPASQVVTLTGTGVLPSPSLSPAALNLGAQALGAVSAPANATLSNAGPGTLIISAISLSGANASDFALAGSSTCALGSSVASGNSCSMAVTLAPSIIGGEAANLVISDNASGGSQTLALSGTGSAPTVSLSPTSLAFASETIGGTSPTQTVTLTNTGNALLNIAGVSMRGNFSQTNNCGTAVAAQASCQFEITFNPAAAGALSGSLSIADSGLGSPQSLALTGTGLAPPSVSLNPPSIGFGSVPTGEASAAQTVTLTNAGGTPLTITGVSASGDFSEKNTCGTTVAAGANCAISVTFTPTATGARSGTLSIGDNAAGSPQSVALSGTGVASAPVVTLSPASLTFAAQFTNSTSAAQVVTLANTGNATLTIMGITASGDFAETNTCGTSVAAGANCAISVTFTPTATAARPGTLAISDNAAGSPQSVALSGTGADLNITPGAGSSTSATVAPGQTASFGIAFTPEAGATGTFALTCTGAPSGATCTPSPASIVVTGGATVSSTVTVSTSAGSSTGPPVGPSSPAPWLPLAAIAAGLAVIAWRRRRILATALLAGACLLTACGGGPSALPPPGNGGAGTSSGATPAGTYGLTVTATQGANSRSIVLTLVVN